MAREVPWNIVIVNEFERIALLSDEEKKILRTRVIDNWTITKQAMTFSMSRSKVNYIIKRLKEKYDSVQPYSDILPPRKKSAKETYMDTH